MADYKTNPDVTFKTGFAVDADAIRTAAEQTNALLLALPENLFSSIDFKTTSAMVGAIFCNQIAGVTGAIVNPIEKGHPDLLPADARNLPESRLRNHAEGLEVKCTVGSIPTGKNLRAGQSRVGELSGITWQAHHREVERLLGVVWDFVDEGHAFHHPAITGAFYSDALSTDDWGAISGTTGRNTKVTAMTRSGREKMGKGWVTLRDEPAYTERFEKLLPSTPSPEPPASAKRLTKQGQARPTKNQAGEDCP
jgi:hypothetical protein